MFKNITKLTLGEINKSKGKIFGVLVCSRSNEILEIYRWNFL